MEHNNNFIKEMIKNEGANVTFKSAQQISRAAMGLEAVLSNLDSILSVKEESGRHAVVGRRKDVLMIAEEIRDNINKKTKPRAHRAFPGLKRDILHQLNPSKLVQWVREKKKSLAKIQSLTDLPDV